MAAYWWDHWSLITLSRDTGEPTCWQWDAESALILVQTLVILENFGVISLWWSQSTGLVCVTAQWMWVTQSYTSSCGLWWATWDTPDLFTFGSSVNAVDAGDLLRNQGLWHCYWSMIYLTFCRLAVSLIVLNTYTVNLSEKGLFLAHRIHGIIWISICFCDKNSKETRKSVVNTWCIPVRDKLQEHQKKWGDLAGDTFKLKMHRFWEKS